jgi:iron complex outermembrane receptor protein
MKKLLVSVPAVLVPAFGWPQAPADEPKKIEKVEIVGSHIKRIEGEAALPVQILSREDIERSGAQTTEEVLEMVSANFNGFKDALSVGNGVRAGFSGASLRGLGSSNTLVLLNGRRLANYAFSFRETGVDLHAIPLAAVERVEVLTDGASAIYGSDAIGGVINFVTRSDYRGGEATLYYGDSQAGGGAVTRATGALGGGSLASDGWNAFAVIDVAKSDNLPSRDRPFAATSYRPDIGLNGLSTNVFPANISLGRGRYVNPVAPNCPAISVSIGNYCLFDYPKLADALPESERASVLGSGMWRISGEVDAFAEMSWMRNRTTIQIAPSPTGPFTSQGAPFILPAGSPYYPQGLGLSGDLSLRYRTVPLGPRTNETESEQFYMVAGVKGRWLDWDTNAAFIYSRSTATDSYAKGYVRESGLQELLASGLLNPFGPSAPEGDAALAAIEVRGATARKATGTTRGVDARFSGDAAELPAGALAVAWGVEARRESLSDETLPIAGDVIGGSYTQPKQGSRNAGAIYVELNVPIVRSLEAQLALRYDRYSDFGGTTNPKIALRWQPATQVLLRGSWGTGFRAPSLPELYTAPGRYLTGAPDITDIQRCPVTGSETDCGDNGFDSVDGGNRSLKPETSTQSNLGIVFEPGYGFSASVDWWRINQQDAIGSLDPAAILADPIAYGRFIVRGPVDPNFPGLPGPITQVIATNQNLGELRTSGIDVVASWQLPATAYGRFGAQMNGTYMLDWRQQQGGSEFVSYIGTNVNGFSVPRWRSYLALNWGWQAWSATLGQYYQRGYTDERPDGEGKQRQVSPYNVWNLNLSWKQDALTLTGGAKNLFDQDPPTTNQSGSSQSGYDPRYADPRGRFFYASATWRFR